jgi:hypothetical protein
MSNRVVDAVAAEVAEEKAGALGRAGRALEAALAALETFNPPADLPVDVREERRRRLVSRAAQLTLSVVVQREACGLRNAGFVLEQYKVPQEVIAALGRRMPR